MNTPNTSLALREFPTYTLTEVEKVGTWIARSGMFGCTKPEQGQVIAIACREKNMNLFEFLDRYHVMFDGRIKLKSHAVFADFRKAGGKVKWIKTGDDGKEASAEVTFEGQTVKTSFTIEQATAQGLVKKDSAWVKTPGNMLRARLITNTIAMLCPEIYSGGDDDAAATVAPLNLGDERATSVTVAPPDNAIEIEIKGQHVPELMSANAVAAAKSIDSIMKQLMADPVPDIAAMSDDSNPELMPEPKPSHELPADLLKQLAKCIGHIESEAVAFCQSINWLKKGETMANLSAGNARYIIGKHEAFIAKATAHAENVS